MLVGEAMGNELPCVVTNAGDAAYLVGDTGKVVPTKHPEAFAQACHIKVQNCRKPETLGGSALN